MAQDRTRFFTATACGVAMAVLIGVSAGRAIAAAAESAAKLADAGPGDVRVFASGSLRATVLAMRDRLEKASGRRLVLESSESRILLKEIEAGQAFEVAMLTTPVIAELATQGKIVAGSQVRLGAVRVGVSVRGEAPTLDIASAEGLKRAILGAHGIRRFYGVGASVPVLDNLFARLGLVDATEARMIHLGGEAVVPEAPLPRGQYELIINLISAIRPMPGWRYLGPIPEEVQMPVDHTAALGAAGDAAVGRKVMEVVRSREFQAALRADGITVN